MQPLQVLMLQLATQLFMHSGIQRLPMMETVSQVEAFPAPQQS